MIRALMLVAVAGAAVSSMGVPKQDAARFARKPQAELRISAEDALRLRRYLEAQQRSGRIATAPKGNLRNLLFTEADRKQLKLMHPFYTDEWRARTKVIPLSPESQPPHAP